MSQTDGANVQSATGRGAAGLFAALKNSFNLLGAQNDIFAEMLTQAAAAKQANAGQDPASSSREQTVDTEVSRHTGLSQSASDDRAALRALLQSIREDSHALYHNRQRIKHARSHPCKGHDDQDADDGAAVSADEDVSATEAAVECTTEVEAPKETAQTSEEADVTAPVAEETQNLPETPVAAAPEDTGANVQQAEGKTETPAAEETQDGFDANAVFADLMAAEQAALLLLRKMLLERVGIHKAGEETGTTETASSETATAETGVDTSGMVLPQIAENESGKNPLKAKTPEDKPQDPLTPFLNDSNTNAAAGNGKTPSGFEALTARNNGKHTEGGAAHAEGKAASAEEFLNLFNAAAPSGNVRGAEGTGSVVKGAGPTGSVTAEGSASAASTGRSNAAPAQQGLPEAVGPVGSYDFASQLSAARVTKGGASGLPSAVEQVTLQLHKQVKDGVQEMTLQLRPAELGRIEIKLSFADGNKVKGTVVADNPATLDLLLKDVGSLQRALQDAGLRADSGSLQFSLRGDGQTNLFNSGSNGNGSSDSGKSGNNGFSAPDSAGTMSEAEVETYYLTPGRVNLRV
ncbi:MAG: flagellar hook-length control protein FliK [Alphaproteobacteria bacterium]|nr:flagellar hook-length control protein FliK [Alphaproteobacteria bacterium]